MQVNKIKSQINLRFVQIKWYIKPGIFFFFFFFFCLFVCFSCFEVLK